MIQKDRLGTIAQHYLDPKSYLCKDGREVLYGEDWKARKWDLWQRCGGRCEAWLEIIGIALNRCTAEAEDPHHLIRRSELRDDRLPNLQALCRFHHDLLDKRKVRSDKRRPAAA